MAYSKRQLIEAAFTEIGLASSSFDITSEEMESALRRLDALMGEWTLKGVRINYPIPSNPEDSSLSSSSNVPEYANRGVILNLALEIAPSFGKVIPRETKIAAKNAYDNILMYAGASQPPVKQMPSTMPKGAGHKTWRGGYNNPFFRKPLPTLPDGTSNILDFD